MPVGGPVLLRRSPGATPCRQEPLLGSSPLAGHSTALQTRGMQRRSWWKESDLNNAAENSAARLVFIILFFQ